MRASKRPGWLFIVIATLVLTCLLTLASMGRPGAPGFPVLHSRQNIAWLTWIVLAPAVILAARRFPFGEGSAMRWLARHLAVGLAFSLAAIAIASAIRALIMSFGHSHTVEPGPPLVASVATGLLIYSLIAVSYQAIAYHGMAKARDAIAAKLRADLAEARLAGIEGKLHPHFLFNALNSIAALVRIDPPRAEVMVVQLSELLRAALRANPMQEVSLGDALELTEQYLAIERVRFQHRLRATVEASDAARRGRVPQLILQPLVENAVRHGIAPLDAGGSVTITARVQGDTLVMTVEDDGVGLGNAPPERAGSGLGLNAVRSALSHLYGTAQRFDIRARDPRGTTVTIAMPYRTAPA
jgi:anti-sigma regulatory factor (Ser/Thr protein kinase)